MAPLGFQKRQEQKAGAQEERLEVAVDVEHLFLVPSKMAEVELVIAMVEYLRQQESSLLVAVEKFPIGVTVVEWTIMIQVVLLPV